MYVTVTSPECYLGHYIDKTFFDEYYIKEINIGDNFIVVIDKTILRYPFRIRFAAIVEITSIKNKNEYRCYIKQSEGLNRYHIGASYPVYKYKSKLRMIVTRKEIVQKVECEEID